MRVKRVLRALGLGGVAAALMVLAAVQPGLAQTPTLSSVSTTVLGAEAVRFTATLSATPSDTTTVFFRYQEDGGGTWILPPAATTDTSTAVIGVSASLSGNTTYTVQASLDANYATVVSESFTTGLYDYALYASRPNTRELHLVDPTDPDSTDGGFGVVGTFATGLANGRALLVQDGLVWVVDVADEELWRVDPDDPDSEEGTLGSVGTFPSGLTHATGMAPVPDSAHLYVLDTEGKELWLIDSTDPDNETGAFGLLGTLPANLSKAVGLGIDDDGDLYTADATNGELWRIDPNDVDSETGDYGEVGAFPVTMGVPVSLTMDANDDLLVLARPALWRINTGTPAQTSGVYGEVGSVVSSSILAISESAFHVPIFLLDPVARTIDENSAEGANVGAAVAATHPGDATLAYTLSGTGADNFAIGASTGQITVAADATIDFETTSSYALTVTAADGPLTATAAVTVTVTNLDEPGVVTLSTNSPQVGTAITATLADPDGGQSSGSWRWDRSTDQTNWTEITGATATSYTPVAADVGQFLRVRVSYLDNVGAAIENASAVTANAVANRAPTFADGATTTRSIAENSAAGATVGAAVTATDPDGHTVTYTLGGTDASSFAINASTGQITVGADATIDFETTASYTVTVTASDGQTPPLTATITVTINVTNVNEAGTVTLSTGAPVVGTAITATLTDPDGSVTITTWRWQRSPDGSNWTLISGASANSYTPVDGDVGLRLRAFAIYHDAAANNNSANSASTNQVVAAAVNRAPTFDDGATTTRSIAENSAAGANVGAAVTATDLDGHTLTYTLGGTDASSFAIDGSTGQLTVGTGTTLDFEATASYTVTVTASDGQTPALTDTITVTISVTNVDEAGAVTLSTNSPQPGTAVTATLADPDGSISSVTWQWARSTDQSNWANITGATGASYTPTRASARQHLRATASYTDGQGSGKTAQAATTNAVPNQPPVFPGALTTRSVAEDAAVGVAVGAAVAATDEEALTYTLLFLPADDATTFTVDNTGQISVGAALDFETQATYNVSLRASDGSLTDTIAVAITVTNVDEAGAVTLSTNAPVDGTAITATLTDPDGSISSVTWQWARSTDQSNWTDITGATSASYTPGSADSGNHLRATASYTDGHGSGKTAATHTTGAVAMDTRPVITIAYGAASVTEGSAAAFTLTSTPAPTAALSVTVQVTTTGAFGVTAGSRTVTIGTGGTGTLSEATAGDGVDEANGSVTATLAAGTDYRLGTPSAATVTVTDDDVPSVSIAGGAAVTEGGDAVFTLTASPAPYQTITVNVTRTVTGSYGITAGAQDVTITTTGTATVTLATSDDSVDEADGSVTLSITAASGTGWSRGAASSATVAVTDDDVPSVSIAGGAAVTEGGDAVFTLTASPAPYQTITVNVTRTVTGSYGITAGAQDVTITTTGTATVTLATVGDTVVESDGSVTVSITSASGAGWTRGMPDSATVAIESDDIDTTPRVSVSAETNRITEGENVELTVRAAAVLTATLDVSVTLTATGSYGISSGSRTVRMIEGTQQATLVLPTDDDDRDETNGLVSAVVAPGSGYIVAGSGVTVIIEDNDTLPTGAMSITAASSGTTVGYVRGSYGTASGTLPAMLFTDQSNRTLQAFTEASNGRWTIEYTGGSANRWKGAGDLVDIVIEVSYADNRDPRRFSMGGHFVSRSGTRSIILNPPLLAARDWEGRSGEVIHVAFSRERERQTGPGPGTPIQDPPAREDSPAGFLLRTTPGGGMTAQVLIVLMVYAAVLLRGARNETTVMVSALALILTPWIPAFFGVGTQTLSVIMLLNVALGAFLYKAYFARTE